MTSDASKFPPKIAKLFEPRPPLVFLESTDIPPAERRNGDIDGISSILPQLTNYTKIEYNPTEGVQQQQQREKKEKNNQQRTKLLEDLKNWNPDNDPQIRGNPYKTLFVGRLAYSVTEVDLQKEFSAYGPIERVRVVRDKNTNQSRGYGFIIFERERDLNAACKEANGKVINDRAIIVDVERGRTVKNWQPRRLGGGIGGRGYTQKQSDKNRNGYWPSGYANKRFGDKPPFRKSYHDSYSRTRENNDRAYTGSRYAGRYESRDRDFFEREREGKSHHVEREREREKFREKRIENERVRGKPKAY